jgi:hypothetical protein
MGQPTEEIEDKRRFHRCDALRYVAIGIHGDPARDPLMGMVIGRGVRSGWYSLGDR